MDNPFDANNSTRSSIPHQSYENIGRTTSSNYDLLNDWNLNAWNGILYGDTQAQQTGIQNDINNHRPSSGPAGSIAPYSMHTGSMSASMHDHLPALSPDLQALFGLMSPAMQPQGQGAISSLCGSPSGLGMNMNTAPQQFYSPQRQSSVASTTAQLGQFHFNGAIGNGMAGSQQQMFAAGLHSSRDSLRQRYERLPAGNYGMAAAGRVAPTTIASAQNVLQAGSALAISQASNSALAAILRQRRLMQNHQAVRQQRPQQQQQQQQRANNRIPPLDKHIDFKTAIALQVNRRFLQACLESPTYREQAKGLFVRVNVGANGTADYLVLQVQDLQPGRELREAVITVMHANKPTTIPVLSVSNSLMTEKEWKASSVTVTVREASECVSRKRTLCKLLGSRAALPAPIVTRSAVDGGHDGEGGADNDLVATRHVVSLKCPISLSRFKTPVRGRLCSHTLCFDRAFFLACSETQKKVIPYDKCPLCQICIVSDDDLIVDEKLQKIVAATDRPPTQKPILQVVLNKDGTWETIEASDTESDDEADGVGFKRARPSTTVAADTTPSAPISATTPTRPTTVRQPSASRTFISLLDSDDE